MDLRSSAHLSTAQGGWIQNPPWHDAPDTAWGAPGPPSPGTERVNIKHTKSAQAWLPVGLGSSPLSHPQLREEQRAR